MMKKHFTFLYLLGSLTAVAQTNGGQIEQPLGFEEYDPVSTLKVSEHKLTRSKYPFIDIHNHQYSMSNQDLSKLVAEMDALNMGVMVNLSGRGWSQQWEEGTTTIKGMLDNVKKNYPKRFMVFTNPELKGVGSPGYGERAAKQVEEDVKAGAVGMKVYKSLGFSGIKDTDGKRVAVSDPRLDPIWAKCGELGIPVIIHTADPKSFWDPLDRYNERWLELKTHAGRKRGNNDPVPFDSLMKEQHAVFARHPKTKFINAHMGWYPNDLRKLDSLMTRFPNMYVEIGAVIAELGRQPRAAKQFFVKWQDKILFGKDSWVPSEYATYFRVLETEDEYFPYHKKYHAFWRMYGMGLPDEVLKKVYYKNAIKLIPAIDKSQFPE
ncbi:putative TIM-barrel fold metal-dependent hydrolase [Runella defluvii]|uniref:Putative TIM-barrel fold metal-dependent hydrolase n=2 Tax=Runella defluvii TaxID=370973 RepID=A0A7W5ZLH3_9BACT|nr:putative TIM-barrel fold metal-dependent hydrolase [Runella defluvii]